MDSLLLNSRLWNYKDLNEDRRSLYSLSKQQQRHRPRQQVFDEPHESKNKKQKSVVICKSCGCCCGGVNKIVPTLPNDLVSEILVRLPADILYYVMRHVCKNWRQIIDGPDFVNAHLHRSSSLSSYVLLASHGWLFTPNPNPNPILENSYSVGSLETMFSQAQLHYKWNKILHVDPIKDLILDSCDGLVLVFKGGVFHVVNPITNQKIILPIQSYHWPNTCYYNVNDIQYSWLLHSIVRQPPTNCAIAYAKSSKKYKAFQVFQGYVSIGAAPFQYKISVLTVGVDNSWRNIFDFHQLQPLNSGAVLSVGGFVYIFVHNNTVLWALDVENETIQNVHAPNHQSNNNNTTNEYQYRYIIKSGRFLFFVLSESFNVYDFWALMDPKTEDWRKLYRIDLNIHKELQICFNRLSNAIQIQIRYPLRPLFVMEEDVVLFSLQFYSNSNLYVGYKVKTNEFFYKLQDNRSLSLMAGVLHLETLVAIQ